MDVNSRSTNSDVNAHCTAVDIADVSAIELFVSDASTCFATPSSVATT
jgi:hypothetical protein